MKDTMSTQYDSFLYWRMPIPELDLSELEHLGFADVALYKPKEMDQKKQSHSLTGGGDDDEEGLLQYNSFNFWRAPIASVGPLDFDLI